MADVLMQRVGPVVGADGTPVPLRGTRDAALVGQDAHGRFYEAVSRGNVWTIATPLAGITVTANMLSSVASANAIVGLYNPTTKTNLHILRAVVALVTVATACNFNWAVNINTLLSPAPLGVQRAHNNLTFAIGGHQAKAFDGSVAVSGAAVTDLFRPIGTLGVAAGPTPPPVIEYDNDIVVGPGCFAGIFGDTVTTATVVRASLTWEEIAV